MAGRHIAAAQSARRYFIGGLARQCGFSVHAIRWYEAQGLMPNVERDRGGRRVYVEGHVAHLAFLDRMRRSGMTIAELKAYTDLSLQGWRSIAAQIETLEAHRARVEDDIAERRRALKLIDEKIAYLVEWDARKKRPPPLPVLAPRPRRR